MKTNLFYSLLILFGFLPSFGNAQYVTVSGYVTHFLTGRAVENATIFEKNSRIGTITNEDGYYKLILAPGQMNFSFSENGFETYSDQFPVFSDTTIIVHLKPEKLVKDQDKTGVGQSAEIDDPIKKSSQRRKLLLF
jgi:hypothetical protein